MYIYICMYSHNKFTLNNNDRRNIYCTRKYYVLHKRLDNGRNVRMVCMSPCIDIPGDQ